MFKLLGIVSTHLGNINLGIVLAIGIHVRALEEVDTDCRRNAGVRTGTGAVNLVTVVAIAQTTLDIASDIVIKSVTKVSVNPLAEVGLAEFVSRTVDDFVCVESHVVDFVIRGECESLCTDFHTNRLAERLGVDITHIVEDPPDSLVTLQHLVGKQTTGNNVGLSFESGGHMRGVIATPLCFQCTGAKCIVEIVVRIVTFFPFVDTIMIGIKEGSKIGRLVGVDAGSGPVFNSSGDGIGRVGIIRCCTGITIVKHGHECKNFILGDDVVLIEIVTDREVDRSSLQLERTGPVVVTFGTETESSNTELIVNIGTADPQCRAEERAGVTVFGQVVLGHTTVVPHVAVAINECSDIVDIQLCGTLCSFAHGSFGLHCRLVRGILFADFTILCIRGPRQGSKQESHQYEFAKYILHI